MKHDKSMATDGHDREIESDAITDLLEKLTRERDEARTELRHLADLLDAHFERGGTVAGIGTTNKARKILSLEGRLVAPLPWGSFLSEQLYKWKSGEIECGCREMAMHVRQIVEEEIATCSIRGKKVRTLATPPLTHQDDASE